MNANTVFFVFQRVNAATGDIFVAWEGDDNVDRMAYFESKADGELRTDMFDDVDRAVSGGSDILNENIILIIIGVK